MSDYTLAVSWSGKDALSDSDSAKVISGDDFDTEFTTARTAINSKADLVNATQDITLRNATIGGTLDVSGVPTVPTQSAGNNTTRVATTAFVTTAVAAVDAAAINAIVYPVGSIYFNMAVSTNPNTLLGMGTWVAYATGQVLVGIEGSGTFDALDESLGAETIGSGTSGSTAADLAAHTHTTSVYSGGGSPGSGVQTGGNTSGTISTSSTGSGGGHTHTVPSHSLLQPSVTVYIWKRTA